MKFTEDEIIKMSEFAVANSKLVKRLINKLNKKEKPRGFIYYGWDGAKLMPYGHYIII
jgi:hypothetical protein